MNDILPGPSLTRSEPHQQQQQPPPSSSQGTTTVNRSIPVVLKSADFPICDDRSEIDPDDRTISGDNNFSSSSCRHPAHSAHRLRLQVYRIVIGTGRRGGELKTQIKQSPHLRRLRLDMLNHTFPLSRRKSKSKINGVGNVNMPLQSRKGHCPCLESNEDLSVSSGSRAVRHCGVNGPLFTLLAPAPAPLASSSGSSCATSSSFTSTATTTGT